MDSCDYDLQYYLKALEMSEELFKIVSSEMDVKKEYFNSYFTYMGKTELNDLWIKLVTKKFKNTSFKIGTMMIGKCENPYSLHLWKYNGGDGPNSHIFKDISLKEPIDLKSLVPEIKEFYGLNQIRYEQLTLF